jgi:hypothetical protein
VTPGAGAAVRRRALASAGIGLYAAAIALAPGWGAKAILCAPLVAIPLLWGILRSANAWLAAFLVSAIVLPPLPIKLGDSGPNLALVFAAAGVLIGLLRLAEWRFHIDALSTAMLALFAIIAASLAQAAIYSGIEIAAASLARALLFGISIYVFLYVRDGPARAAPPQESNLIRLLYWAAAVSAAFACVDFYFQFPAPAGYEQQFIWLDSGVYRRAQGVFYEASTLGNFCAFFLEMIAVALFRPREARPVPRPAMLVGGVAFAGALLLSYSRGSLINLGVALIALLWLHRARIRFGRVAARIAVFGGAAVAILAIGLPTFARYYWLRVLSASHFFFESPNTALSGRVQSWKLLVDFLRSNPWHAIFGIGYKTLPYSDFIGTKAVADNAYLGMLAETGILGLLAVLALNVAIIKSSHRASLSADPLRSFCGAWMLCFWAGQTVQMFSGDLLTYWRVLPVYFFVLALAAREPAHERSFSRPIR